MKRLTCLRSSWRVFLLAAYITSMAGCGPRYHVRTIEKYQVPEHTAESVIESETTSVVESEAGKQEEKGYQTSETLLYTVRSGDTLRGIAKRELGRTLLWRHLMEWNKRTEGALDPLPEGEVIEVPLQFRILAGTTEFAESTAKVSPPAKRLPVIPKIEMAPPGQVFNVGEHLTFAIKWYFITAGKATMTVKSLETFQGTSCYRFVARATSRLIFFFKVNDWVESYSTSDTLMPIQYEKHLREGRYKKDVVATFDRERQIATWGGVESPLIPGCRDILASFYYFRTMRLPKPGEQAAVCVNTNKKNYELIVHVLSREIIRVPAGEFRTVLIKPRLKFEGLFRQRGDVLIWLTDDQARLPVLIKSKVKLLGSVHIVLTKIELG